MYTTFINGKERKLKATAGSVIRISKKYKAQIADLTKAITKDEEFNADLNEEEFLNFIFEMVWELIAPNFIGLKPFVTFARFKDKIDNLELNEASKKAFFLLRGVPEEDYSRIQKTQDEEGRKGKKVGKMNSRPLNG
ncbi:MAG TPA: hypothetical protein VMV77_14190 [Bacteroidales bacterium]|nr:hypothetical protein [Bacteroidales bacterium]